MRAMELGEELAYCKIAEHPMLFIGNESRISDLQYKLICKEPFQGLLNCRWLRLDGKLYLAYRNGHMLSLKDVLRNLKVREAIRILDSIVDCVLEVLDNAYLHVSNLLLDMEYMFIERNSFSVNIMYIPVNGAHIQGEEAAQRQIKEFFVEYLEKTKLCDLFEGRSCIHFLRDKKLDLYETLHFVKDAFVHIKDVESQTKTEVILSSRNTLRPIEIRVVESPHIVSNQFQAKDGSLEKIATVSRKHCEISVGADGVYVKDLNSRNGTYLNNRKLAAEEKHCMKNGDTLCLANILFEVNIKGI